MTTIFTRLYPNPNVAEGVQDRLYRAGFPRHSMRVVTRQPDDGVSDIKLRIDRARVPDREASVYAEGVVNGNALLIVAADYRPLGAVKTGRRILEGTNALPCNVETEEFRVTTLPDHAPYVLKDHPRFLTAPPDTDHTGGPLSDQFGFSMVSSERRGNSAIEGGKRILPFLTVIKNRRANSAIRGGFHVSRAFWPMKLVTGKPRRNSVIRGGGHPLSRLLGWRTIS